MTAAARCCGDRAGVHWQVASLSAKDLNLKTTVVVVPVTTGMLTGTVEIESELEEPLQCAAAARDLAILARLPVAVNDSESDPGPGPGRGLLDLF